jgi:acetyltransferase-like isoleucine patch superfamily enzyme
LAKKVTRSSPRRQAKRVKPTGPTRQEQIPHLISRGAKIGKNVRIWNYAYVGPNTSIGDNTKIGSLAHVDYNVVIGKDCKIEGLAYIAPLSKIGNKVFIGPSACLTNDPYPLSDKMIGVTVKDGALICAGSIIKAGVTIGENSVVGMGAVVTKDVPPNSVVIGTPARYVYSREDYERKRLNWNSSK